MGIFDFFKSQSEDKNNSENYKGEERRKLFYEATHFYKKKEYSRAIEKCNELINIQTPYETPAITPRQSFLEEAFGDAPYESLPKPNESLKAYKIKVFSKFKLDDFDGALHDAEKASVYDDGKILHALRSSMKKKT